MFLIIFSIVLAIILTFILGCHIDLKREETDFKPCKRMWLGLLPLLLILFECFATVQTGEIGVKTRFGKIVGTTANEGIVFKLPYEKVIKVEACNWEEIEFVEE